MVSIPLALAYSVLGAIIEYHEPSGLQKNGCMFLMFVDNVKSKIRMLADLMSGKDLISGS